MTASARHSHVQASSALLEVGTRAVSTRRFPAAKSPPEHPTTRPPRPALSFRPRVSGEDLGFRDLMASLSAVGADSLLMLPGVDDPISAPEYMRRALGLIQRQGIPFEEAWSSAINRIQAPQGEGGLIADPRVGALVREERALLEEDRPKWRAAYERREPTTREKAVCIVGAWRRFDKSQAGA